MELKRGYLKVVNGNMGAGNVGVIDLASEVEKLTKEGCDSDQHTSSPEAT